MQPRFPLILSCFIALVSSGSILAQTPSTAHIDWLPVDAAQIALRGERQIIPEKYSAVTVDLNQVREVLAFAPAEFVPNWRQSGLLVPLPMPDGETALFRVWDSPIMAPGLGNRYPEIRTFRGVGENDRTASVRIDYSHKGFHAMIISASGTVYIDPYSTGNTTTCISYHKRDYTSAEDRVCLLDDEQENAFERATGNGTATTSHGEELRTYRLALACTGEYATFHGGTVPDVLAAFVTTINRVNGIYEREVSVRLELIANTDQLIFLDGSTDPYTNNSGSAMLGQNQTTIGNIIGSSNYDMGHVFSTGGGGIASLGSVCSSQNKARGVTGLGAPIGDSFDVDFVAHEMGHQFGGSHTFNGNAGSCSGNVSASNAYEPGSGSTIMAYGGICGSHNVANGSDDYFHTRSFDQIRAYITVDTGDNCPMVTNTGNSDPNPIANPENKSFTIPIETPFWLEGTGSDPNGDSITFCWEQMDLGPAGHPDLPVGDAPLFRSFLPTTSPRRYFPRLVNTVNNFHTKGEILPAISRTMNFRLTARDNLGGVKHDGRSLDVSDLAGPFVVTQPSTPATYLAGQVVQVDWDVANTQNAPVSCQKVNILLSVDGGYTYAYTLLANTANDGSQLVNLPNTTTSDGRIKVESADNVFFDLNDDDLTITRIAVDGGVPAIAYPTGAISYLSTTVKAWIHNYGTDPISNFQVLLKKNGAVITTENFTGTIQPGDSALHTFATPLTALGGPIDLCVAISGIANDGEPNNDEHCNSLPVALGVEGLQRTVSRIYPVPASDQLVLELANSSGNLTFTAVDATGKQVLSPRQLNTQHNRAMLDVSTLANGVYFYRLETVAGPETGRFVVLH